MNPARPGFKEALRVWFKIGCIGFGGPSGQIALLHRETVEHRQWISEEEFARALKFCMLLPGPEAQQLATWIGWRLHGIRGGIATGVLFVLPAALLLWGLGVLYVMGRDWPLLYAFFDGLKPAVAAIVVSALWRIGQRMVTGIPLGVMAVVAFALFLLQAPYPMVVIGSAILGALLFARGGQSGPMSCTAEEPLPESSNLGKSLRLALGTALLWLIPVIVLIAWLGAAALPTRIALFFAKVAVFSFGGAYAALSYVSFHAAGDWGWITRSEMIDGLGLAETTPGPLLISLQFVAFLACYKAPGMLAPLFSATLGSLAALWSLFLPSFLWIFALAPHMERFAGNRRMAGALAAIGAVVTAVIAHLALWFARGVFLPQDTLAIVPLVIALGAFLLLQFGRIGIVPLILGCGLIGMVVGLIG